MQSVTSLYDFCTCGVLYNSNTTLTKFLEGMRVFWGSLFTISSILVSIFFLFDVRVNTHTHTSKTDTVFKIVHLKLAATPKESISREFLNLSIVCNCGEIGRTYREGFPSTTKKPYILLLLLLNLKYYTLI